MTQFTRRTAVAAAVTAVAAPLAFAGEPKKEAPKADAKHNHGAGPPPNPANPKLVAVADATAHCVQRGRVCLANGTESLKAGMDMAVCQRATMNMLAVCEAMNACALYNNADAAALKALAVACAQFCRACEKACEPHAAHHAACKACGEACKACAAACDALSA